jgi:CheY-like chemotaxis protein
MLLPEVDGWTLFLHVKQRYPNIPFVFVTAIDDSSVRQAAAREGAADYLQKPFTEAAQIESDTARILEGKTLADPSTVQ